MEWLASRVRTATDLITAIATIVEVITLEALGNAVSTGALELVVTAWGTTWLWVAGFLVGVVTTIVLTIATPGALHTLRVGAQELIRLASTSMAAAVLIRSVRAVGQTIANVGLVNALTIHTGCLVLAASCRWAFVIVVNCRKRAQTKHM